MFFKHSLACSVTSSGGKDISLIDSRSTTLLVGSTLTTSSGRLFSLVCTCIVFFGKEMSVFFTSSSFLTTYNKIFLQWIFAQFDSIGARISWKLGNYMSNSTWKDFFKWPNLHLLWNALLTFSTNDNRKWSCVTADKTTLLFLFSFLLGSVFHEHKVSSLNMFEGVFAQRHSFMKATYRCHT